MMGRLGLVQDLTGCGPDPCGLWDYVYASDSCLAYKTCATPNDPTTILENQGLIAGGGTIIGGSVGQGVTNLVQSTFTNSETGGLNVIPLLVAFGILFILVKR